MTAAKVRHLTCCCCGALTKGRPWWNRDEGYGLCPNCVEFTRGFVCEAEHRDCYGEPGVHYFEKGDEE